MQSSGTTKDITLLFRCIKDEEFESGFEIQLIDYGPKGIEEANCKCMCQTEEYTPYLCEACAMEESISNIGPNEWLEEIKVNVDRIGYLKVVANTKWSVFDCGWGPESDEEHFLVSFSWYDNKPSVGV